jgi:tRNA(Ile)-lysidine synthase
MMVRRSVERFIASQGIKPGASFLIGYSGGPDSTCLFSVMKEIQSRFQYQLSGAYLNHGIRSSLECRAEEEHVRRSARQMGIPLFVKTIPEGDIEKTARQGKLSLETAARMERKTFFKELKAEHGFQYLLLGHTENDQIETILMRILQGSGPGGLRGIRARNGWILRPLLRCSRREIEEYLNEAGLSFFIDSSNEGNRFIRNQVRHELLPVLQQIFPGLGRSLHAFGMKMDFIHDYCKKNALHSLVWEKTSTGVTINAKIFFSAAPVLRMYSLYHEFGSLIREIPFRNTTSLPFRFIRPLLAQKIDMKKKISSRGYGVTLQTRREGLFLERDIVSRGKKGYVINVKLGFPIVLFDQQYILVSNRATKPVIPGFVALFDAQKVKSPFIIRSWQAGDRIDLGFGEKKLKKIFNEWKVEKEGKALLPVLEDADGILAVLGGLGGYKNLIRCGAEVKDCNAAVEKLVLSLYQ